MTGIREIHKAAESGDIKVIESLLNKGVNIDDDSNNDWKPIHYACRHGQLEAAKVLVARGADMNVRDSISGRKPSHVAVMGGHTNVLEFLLSLSPSKGVSLNDVDDRRDTLLHYAASENKLQVLEFLLRKGANINAENDEGQKPIHLAAACGKQTIIEAFLRNGVSVDCLDKEGMTPLFHAAQHDRLQVFKYLIDRGADLNAVAYDGRKVIHSAARGGLEDTGVLEYLVSRKVNIDATDNNGFTPLLYGARYSRRSAAKFLIAHGARVDARSSDGQTVLHRAAQNNSRLDLEFFLKRGLDIDGADDNGWTALHHVILTDKGKYLNGKVFINVDVVRFLVGRGADVDTKDKKGKNPVDYAIGLMDERANARDAVAVLMAARLQN